MAKRGRKSSASLTVVPTNELGEPIKADALPTPPDSLTDEQADEWRDIVPFLDVSRGRWPLIEAYCKHSIALRHVGDLIIAIEDPDQDNFDVKDYDRLLKMQERESRCLASLSVRLGIAQSSSYERHKRNAKQKPPWKS